MNTSSSKSSKRRTFRAERVPMDHKDAPPDLPSDEAAGMKHATAARMSASSEGMEKGLDEIREELVQMKQMLSNLCGTASAVTSEDGSISADTDLAVRIEIARMVKMIGQAKSEISHIKHPGADSSQIEDARGELDAIVDDTAKATEIILGQAEEQMDMLTRLAGCIAGDREAEAFCAKVEEATIKIMESCNFQDLTGQRTTKVITALRHIEERIVAMIGIWGIEAFAELPVPMDEVSGDEALLNGPARSGEGISQADIDALFD